MTFGAVLHKELLWDFSFSVLGHGIITQTTTPSSWPDQLRLQRCEGCYQIQLSQLTKVLNQWGCLRHSANLQELWTIFFSDGVQATLTSSHRLSSTPKLDSLTMRKNGGNSALRFRSILILPTSSINGLRKIRYSLAYGKSVKFSSQIHLKGTKVSTIHDFEIEIRRRKLPKAYIEKFKFWLISYHDLERSQLRR